MTKTSLKTVSVGDYSVEVREDIADLFQEELDQLLILLKMTDGNVKVSEEFRDNIRLCNIIGLNESVGWFITFLTKQDEQSGFFHMDVVVKLSFDEIVQIRNELKDMGYSNNVFRRLSGVRVEKSEECCIELLRKLKVRL